MPKKKFINGSTAKYALLPSHQESTLPLSWIRTDSNYHFKPFAEVEQDRTQPVAPANHTDAVGPRFHVAQANTQSMVHGTIAPCCPADGYEYERHLRVIGTDPSAIYLNAMISDRTRTSTGESSSIMHTEYQAYREDEQRSEDDLDDDLNLTDADSNFSDNDEVDEYDAFFNRLLVLRPPERELHRRHQNDTCQPQHRFGNEERARGTLLDDSSFNDLMRLYDTSNDQETNPNTSSAYEADEEILGAIANMSMISKSVETEHRDFYPNTQAHADSRPFEDNARAIERSLNFRSNMDCESVLSDYSILENHPKLLVISSTKQLSKNHRDASRLETRLPIVANELGVSASVRVQEEHNSRWRQNLVRKGESREEKKARKAAVKKGRKEARELKKGLKDAFKREETLQRTSIGQIYGVPSNASVKKFDS